MGNRGSGLSAHLRPQLSVPASREGTTASRRRSPASPRGCAEGKRAGRGQERRSGAAGPSGPLRAAPPLLASPARLSRRHLRAAAPPSPLPAPRLWQPGSMAAVETRVCETAGCSSEAKLQCPTCLKLGIQGSYFCSQVRPPALPPAGSAPFPFPLAAPLTGGRLREPARLPTLRAGFFLTGAAPGSARLSRGGI